MTESSYCWSQRSTMDRIYLISQMLLWCKLHTELKMNVRTTVSHGSFAWLVQCVRLFPRCTRSHSPWNVCRNKFWRPLDVIMFWHLRHSILFIFSFLFISSSHSSFTNKRTEQTQCTRTHLNPRDKNESVIEKCSDATTHFVSISLCEWEGCYPLMFSK